MVTIVLGISWDAAAGAVGRQAHPIPPSLFVIGEPPRLSQATGSIFPPCFLYHEGKSSVERTATEEDSNMGHENSKRLVQECDRPRTLPYPSNPHKFDLIVDPCSSNMGQFPVDQSQALPFCLMYGHLA